MVESDWMTCLRSLPLRMMPTLCHMSSRSLVRASEGVGLGLLVGLGFRMIIPGFGRGYAGKRAGGFLGDGSIFHHGVAGARAEN